MLTVDFDRLGAASGSRILDIGCGSGRHTAAAVALPAAIAVGIDTCRADLKSAEERLDLHHRWGATAGGSWSFASADALQIPFRDGVFDVVICSEVLEHIPDHREAVREAVRVLRPGGCLVVSVPRFWPEKICWWLSRAYANTEGGHIRIYKAKDLIELLTSEGMKTTAKHYAHSLHAPYWWLKCLVGPNRDDSTVVRLYHRFLTWDMVKKKRPVRFLERLLNPLMGKSVVVYLKKRDGRPGRRKALVQ